jgi:hypothetical protein
VEKALLRRGHNHSRNVDKIGPGPDAKSALGVTICSR